jgi:hypothetical protein
MAEQKRPTTRGPIPKVQRTLSGIYGKIWKYIPDLRQPFHRTPIGARDTHVASIRAARREKLDAHITPLVPSKNSSAVGARDKVTLTPAFQGFVQTGVKICKF